MMTPRYYQAEASDASIEFLDNGEGNGLLALPTGSGKSLIIADIIKRKPKLRVLMLVHTQKIIKQNAERLKEYYPEADLGICSSGIGEFETKNHIVFGGIATVKNRTDDIGHVDLLIVDEVHCFSNRENSMYFQTFTKLKKINPNIRIIGLSATTFRTGYGRLLDNKLFHEMIYDICNWESYNRLVAEGFLADIITNSPNAQIDTKGIAIQNGDFNQKQLQEAVGKNDVTVKALQEAVKGGADRKKWMCFGVGIDHVIEIEKILNLLGVSAVAVHSKMSSEAVEEAFAGFKDDTYKCIISNNMIIAGFDEPRVDFIACLRPTKSSSLYVQMIGRGGRPCEGKKNLYVMDFANNALTNGCVNDPIIPKEKGKGKGVAPTKICPKCNCFNHLSARVCIVCGEEFKIQKHISKFSSAERLLRKAETDPVTSNCLRQVFQVRQKEGRCFLQVKYVCEGVTLHDWFWPESKLWWQKAKSVSWWKARMPNIPTPTKAMSAYEKKDLIPKPIRICWKYGRKYPTIVSTEYSIDGKVVVIAASSPAKKKKKVNPVKAHIEKQGSLF